MTTLKSEDKIVAAILAGAMKSENGKVDAASLASNYIKMLKLLARRAHDVEKALDSDPAARPAKAG